GVGVVILIVSILEGFRSSIEADLNILGANVFQVQRYNGGGDDFHDPDKKEYRKILKKELADAIRARCPSVRFVGAENWKSGQAIAYKDRKTNLIASVAGATKEFAINNGYFMKEGRFIIDHDVRFHRKVAVLGMDIVDQLFPVEYPIGRTVKIKGQKFTVVGIFEEQGSSTFGQSRDNRVAIPITTWQDLYGKNHSVNLTIMAKNRQLFAKAQNEVIGVLRKERKVPAGEENNFHLFSNETLIDSFNNIASKIQLGGIGIGIISLIVGGIGVMNIMLVSVTERTREIGIRKAVGARKKDVLKQFLLEAITLCILGGLLGYVTGVGLAGLISLAVKLPMSIPLWSVIAAIATTTVVGIFAGLYPARKAATLPPIEALRYE
ncbi:FtsX-like permease family protein, partial [Candidatus Saccharibacteria bacterium]|nr:FtsX-like permease family protein [Calditrichia bacterium]NIV71588.1 FtsX-like permease family protein [Calditrichia bacterium]NIV98201.1 FtsX-like permease family protein [Candidatus Saccharibacteria bacterium]NIW78476.1 FtsX-like permease family protein [Calditrichia bacterium]